MKRERVQSATAPAAVGPYSQAIAADGLVFCSGQVAIEPQTGQLSDGDVSAQTRQVLLNLREVLRAAGLDMDAVVRTTVYLADMDDFAAVNEVYGSFFGEVRPARSTVAVAALPLGAQVEIDAIAAR